MLTRLLIALGLLLRLATPSAQTDLDAFMARVLARRDENWKKLQQYVLEERETFQIDGAAGSRLFGFEREYSWFVRDGVFIRSPLKADGVAIGEAERRQEENRVAAARAAAGSPSRGARPGWNLEPRFVSSAYFLDSSSTPGSTPLPHASSSTDARFSASSTTRRSCLPKDGRARTGGLRERDDQIEEKMNKVVARDALDGSRRAPDPAVPSSATSTWTSCPAALLARVDSLSSSMRMGEPFPGVWLPRSIGMRVRWHARAPAASAAATTSSITTTGLRTSDPGPMTLGQRAVSLCWPRCASAEHPAIAAGAGNDRGDPRSWEPYDA